jgi:hypothetical protein
MPVAERLKKRYGKFRAHGHFIENTEPDVNGAVPQASAA